MIVKAYFSILMLASAVMFGSGCRIAPIPHQTSQMAGPIYSDVPATSPEVSIPASNGDNYNAGALRPGDAVVIYFNELGAPGKQISIMANVRDDGTITLLSNKVFTAAGKTAREFEKEVSNQYGPKLYPIAVTDLAPIEVSGEVKAPGKRPFTGGMTVLKAVESAGGFTERANKRKVRVSRGDGEEFVINCVKARQNASLDIRVHPNDRITVLRSFWKL